jgi:hypothetical protein
MNGKRMEVRMQGLGVYAIVLADSKLSAVGERELVKGRKDKAPAIVLGLVVGSTPQMAA